jgi:hypothetical protein
MQCDVCLAHMDLQHLLGHHMDITNNNWCDRCDMKLSGRADIFAENSVTFGSELRSDLQTYAKSQLRMGHGLTLMDQWVMDLPGGGLGMSSEVVGWAMLMGGSDAGKISSSSLDILGEMGGLVLASGAISCIVLPRFLSPGTSRST